MPSFDDAATTAAPVEEVWKILYDPSRFPEWWAGVGSVQDPRASGDGTDYTMYPDGYPDFPMPQTLRTSAAGHRVIVSCLVTDQVFAWTLEPRVDAGTTIRVHVDVPDADARRLADQQAVIAASLQNLARLAAMAN